MKNVSEDTLMAMLFALGFVLVALVFSLIIGTETYLKAKCLDSQEKTTVNLKCLGRD